ncbi:large ribosomal subunit protein mL66-like [Lineus longissimus]|uniref:large ribosomal subunit protein mL66-like n=1 Tax=Lineus longissimus TaxID=88925 RepID=UPI00315DDB3F
MVVSLLKFTRFSGAIKVIENVAKLHNFDGKLGLVKCTSSNLSNKVSFSTSNRCNLKEIVKKEQSGVTVVEGRYVGSPRSDYVAPHLKSEEHQGACPLCRLNLNVDYTDVLILSQFLDPSGEVLPREITGLCRKQHGKVEFLVERSKRAGLMSNYPTPPLANPKWTPRPYLDRKYKVFYKKRRPQRIPVYQD